MTKPKNTRSMTCQVLAVWEAATEGESGGYEDPTVRIS